MYCNFFTSATHDQDKTKVMVAKNIWYNIVHFNTVNHLYHYFKSFYLQNANSVDKESILVHTYNVCSLFPVAFAIRVL